MIVAWQGANLCSLLITKLKTYVFVRDQYLQLDNDNFHLQRFLVFEFSFFLNHLKKQLQHRNDLHLEVYFLSKQHFFHETFDFLQLNFIA